MSGRGSGGPGRGGHDRGWQQKVQQGRQNTGGRGQGGPNRNGPAARSSNVGEGRRSNLQQPPPGCPAAAPVQGSVDNVTSDMEQMVISKSPPDRTDAERKQDIENDKAARREKNKKADEKAAKRKADHERWLKASANIGKYTASDLNLKTNNSEAIKGNFFQVDFVDKSKDYHRYRIQLGKIDDREPTNLTLRRKLIELLFTLHPPSAAYWASDYQSTVISVGRLYAAWNEQKALPRPHPRQAAATNLPAQATNTTVGANIPPDLDSVIHFEGNFNFKMLSTLVSTNKVPVATSAVSSGSSNIPPVLYHPDKDINALNIISWHDINSPNFDGVRIGKKFFPRNSSVAEVNREDENKRQWPVYQARLGFFTSMRPADKQLLLNVNATTAAFYPAMLLQDWMQSRWGVAIGNFPFHGASEFREMKGLKVTFECLNPTRVWHIWSVSIRTVSHTGFQPNGLAPITVYSYMTQKYGPNGTVGFHPRAFCINVGSDGPGKQIWLPADKLHIVPDQPVPGKLPSYFTDGMVRAAARRPVQNETAVTQQALLPLGISPKRPFWAGFGLKVGTKLVEMAPRYLAQPTIQFGSKPYEKLQLEDFSKTFAQQKTFWDLKSRKFFEVPESYPKLCAILIKKGPDSRWSSNYESAVRKFGSHLARALPNYGFKTSPDMKYKTATVPDIHDTTRRRLRFEKILSRAHGDMADMGAKPPPLVVIFLESDDVTTFSDVKRWADCVRGVPSVCIRPKAVWKSNGSKGNSGDQRMLGNICLKINFKLGGQNHILNSKTTNWYGANEGTMVVGADVTHSGQSSGSTIPSLASVVATNDSKNGHFLGSARLQSNNTEFIEDLQGMMEDRLKCFVRTQNRPPAHILFYRDGVSESQYGMVYEEELPQIRRAVSAVRSGDSSLSTWHPKITLLVVGKRHHTRFFPKHAKPILPGDKNQDVNLQAGLVIDHTVINAHQFTFYLQSHDSPQGTAKSAHYVVIINESEYSMDQLQEITHKLCFTGSRATTALSVCTPARYADILCDRLRCYMRPVLDGLLPQDTLDAYRGDAVTWRPTEQGNRTNPWHSRLENTMFYL